MACIRKFFAKCNGFNPTPASSSTVDTTTVIGNNNVNTGRYTLHSEQVYISPYENGVYSLNSSPHSTNNIINLSNNKIEIEKEEQENNNLTTNSIINNTNQSNNNNNNINNVDDIALENTTEIVETTNTQYKTVTCNNNNKEIEIKQSKLNNNETISKELSQNDVPVSEPEEQYEQKYPIVEKEKQFSISDCKGHKIKILNSKATLNNKEITTVAKSEKKNSWEKNENKILNKIIKFESMKVKDSINELSENNSSHYPKIKSNLKMNLASANNQRNIVNGRSDSTNNNKRMITKAKAPEPNSTIGKYSLELTKELRKQEIFIAKQKENKKLDKLEQQKQQAAAFTDKNNPLVHTRRHKQHYYHRYNRPQQHHLLRPDGMSAKNDINYSPSHHYQHQQQQQEQELQASLLSNTHLIGNKEYEDARRNHQPPQYIGVSKYAPIYLEELKLKQKQQLKHQHQLLCKTFGRNIPLQLKKDNTTTKRESNKHKNKNSYNNSIYQCKTGSDDDAISEMKILTQENKTTTKKIKNAEHLNRNEKGNKDSNYNTIKRTRNRELLLQFNASDIHNEKDNQLVCNKLNNNVKGNMHDVSGNAIREIELKNSNKNETILSKTGIEENTDDDGDYRNGNIINIDKQINNELILSVEISKKEHRSKWNDQSSIDDIKSADEIDEVNDRDSHCTRNNNNNISNDDNKNFEKRQKNKELQHKNFGKSSSHGRDSGVQVDEPDNQQQHKQQQQQQQNLSIGKRNQQSDGDSSNRSGSTNNRSLGSNSNGTDVGRMSDTSKLREPKGKASILNPEESNENLRKGLIFHRRSDKIEPVDIPIFEKEEEIRILITRAIEKNDFLNNYMDKERKKRVIDAMEPEFYDKGEFIIKENEEGSEIYVSEMGEFEVIKNNKVLTTLGSGIVFGELAILYNAKRFASIKAKTKAKVWKIDRTKFRTIMLISGSEERKENLKFLKSSPFLKELSDDVLLRICELLKRKFFPTDTRIIRQGDKGDVFFIIRGGYVTIKRVDENGLERIVDRRKRGQYFGEQALLNSDKRLASVYADSPGTECLILDRETFINYLGTIAELKEIPKDRDIQPEIKIPPSQFDFIKLKDLKKITCLGAGAFGVVDLVTYNDKYSFALKVVKKIDVIKQGQIDHIYNEKLVMSICRNSPFIIELYNTFRDNKYVYFLMEACLGGDVWTIMYQRKFFDEKTARFISGCVVEAFDFLHTRNIIYRDLKPENLMVTPDGYCKLVDFGFAKRLVNSTKTNTFAGTPEYVAPEIILDRGHDRAVDYWALGILIYELLAGRTPFRGTNQMKIYQQILTGIDAVKMSARITRYAQNLIKSLCKQTPAERLGYQRRGILDIKKHSWYDGFDWNKLRNRQISSPIKRPTTSYIDTQYFPTKFENDGNDPPEEMSGWDDEF